LQGKSNELETCVAKLSTEKDDLAARNCTLAAQIGTIQSTHAKQVEEMQRRIVQLEKERRDLAAEKDSAAKQHEQALEHAMKEHTTELAKAKADFDAAATSISERLREAQQTQSQALEASKKEQAMELARIKEEQTHLIDTERKKVCLCTDEVLCESSNRFLAVFDCSTRVRVD